MNSIVDGVGQLDRQIGASAREGDADGKAGNLTQRIHVPGHPSSLTFNIYVSHLYTQENSRDPPAPPCNQCESVTPRNAFRCTMELAQRTRGNISKSPAFPHLDNARDSPDAHD